MPVSRPLLIALVVSIVALAVVMAMRAIGGGEQATKDAGPMAAQTSAAMAPKPDLSRPARAHVRDAAAREARHAARGDSPQDRVLRAIARHKVVVLFFGQRSGADDVATRRSVQDVARKRRDAAVFLASIKNVSRYPRVVPALGIQQSPSTVVIDRKGQARLVGGFVDEGSLLQLVDDAH